MPKTYRVEVQATAYRVSTTVVARLLHPDTGAEIKPTRYWFYYTAPNGALMLRIVAPDQDETINVEMFAAVRVVEEVDNDEA